MSFVSDSNSFVVKAHGSSWERFGAGVRDMPFLNNVFHNPFFERMMGESEIAASIREMKEIDPYFQLEDFSEDIEYVIAPHVVKNYLEGNDKSLEVHCGEAAFAAVNASIKARHQQKLTLDTSVLAGPKEAVYHLGVRWRWQPTTSTLAKLADHTRCQTGMSKVHPVHFASG